MERDIDSFEDDTDLVNVDGTKVKLSGKVLKVMVIPRNRVSPSTHSTHNRDVDYFYGKTDRKVAHLKNDSKSARWSVVKFKGIYFAVS